MHFEKKKYFKYKIKIGILHFVFAFQINHISIGDYARIQGGGGAVSPHPQKKSIGELNFLLNMFHLEPTPLSLNKMFI